MLNGPGFTDMPAALHQGTWPTAYLRSQAATTRCTAYRRPLARDANNGTRWIMVSNACDTKIDATTSA